MEILARMIKPEGDIWPIETARMILDWKLAREDVDRVNALCAKARAGTITVEERAELDDYEETATQVEIMQSKARIALKQAGVAA